ncbi:MAG: hypothetical protein HOE90_03985 [Bacteriovoracaceae bacterium]|jgi:hypothetical protein|nr:hypothetical protein [Bacteriovoracaceae bacterium]
MKFIILLVGLFSGFVHAKCDVEKKITCLEIPSNSKKSFVNIEENIEHLVGDIEDPGTLGPITDPCNYGDEYHDLECESPGYKYQVWFPFIKKTIVKKLCSDGSNPIEVQREELESVIYTFTKQTVQVDFFQAKLINANDGLTEAYIDVDRIMDSGKYNATFIYNLKKRLNSDLCDENAQLELKKPAGYPYNY